MSAVEAIEEKSISDGDMRMCSRSSKIIDSQQGGLAKNESFKLFRAPTNVACPAAGRRFHVKKSARMRCLPIHMILFMVRQ
jgi:hypothetical protein